MCMLAVALDEDEIASYRSYLFAGGKADDYPWSHEDLCSRMDGKRITTETGSRLTPRAAEEQTVNLFRQPGMEKVSKVAKGTVEEAMAIMGIPVVDVPLDKNGVPIVPAGYIFVDHVDAQMGQRSFGPVETEVAVDVPVVAAAPEPAWKGFFKKIK